MPWIPIYRIPPTLPFNLYYLGKWFDIDVRVIVIVPGVLHEVVEDVWDPVRLETGEYLVTTPNGTTFRHREGIYSARRAGEDFERKHPKHNPAKAGKRHAASHDELAHYGRLIQAGTISIIDGVNGYLAGVCRLANGRDDLDPLRAQLMSDLRVLTLRPYGRWCQRMRLTLAENGDRRKVVAYCQIVLARISIEDIMSRLSHALRDVQRHDYLPGLLDQHLPRPDLVIMANAVTGASSRLRASGEGLVDSHELFRTTRALQHCSAELERGTAQGAKQKLDKALVSFDLL
jgi:hypothetical protein